jgi:hypothetical protein
MAIGFHGGVENFLALPAQGDIRLHGNRFPAQSPDFGSSPLGFVAMDIVDEQPGPSFGAVKRQSPADSVGRARDDNDFIPVSFNHREHLLSYRS